MNTPEMDTEELVRDRGKTYGPPALHFRTTQALFNEWRRRRIEAMTSGAEELTNSKEAGVRHAVYMILDKLARAAETPSHLDNWNDIGGYAKCAVSVLNGDGIPDRGGELGEGNAE